MLLQDFDEQMFLKAFYMDLTQEDAYRGWMKEWQGCRGNKNKIYYFVNTPAENWDTSLEEWRDTVEHRVW
jgi:hypothetical protein